MLRVLESYFPREGSPNNSTSLLRQAARDIRAIPQGDGGEAVQLREALAPFVSGEQWRALLRTINKGSSDMEPVTVTVTLGQFKAARQTQDKDT